MADSCTGGSSRDHRVGWGLGLLKEGKKKKKKTPAFQMGEK